MKYNDHGDDRYLYKGIDIRADFSSNVPNIPHDEGLWNHLSSHFGTVYRYPEPRAFSLEERIAEELSIDKDCVLVTNGATEAIYLIAQLYQGASSFIYQPTFSEYLHAASAFGHKISQNSPDLKWLCNPNNPTGQVYPHSELLSEIKIQRDTIFVIDQSYHKFTEKEVLDPRGTVGLPNCFLIQSLTKSYGIPGLRLGYVIANPLLIRDLIRLKMPWSVNAMAIEAGDYLLRHPLAFSLTELLNERERLVSNIERLGIMEIMPTDTHFFTAKLIGHTSQKVKDWLVMNHGILIRNASNFPGLTPHHIRIATQSPQQNDHLVDALSVMPKDLC